MARLPPDDFATRWERASPADRKELLRARFRFDLRGFAKFCFPEQFKAPFIDGLHDHMIDSATERPGWRERSPDDPWRSGLAAPRGYAKSTIASFLVPVHRMAYDLEAVVMVISVTGPDAIKLSRRIQAAFRRPTPEFGALYGPFKVTGGVTEWSVTLPNGSVLGVVARTPGGNVRGYFHPENGVRPTLVLLDDSEDKDDVKNPRLRADWWTWLSDDVMKLGARGSITDVRLVGTILHVDSGLARLVKTPGWNGKVFKAIISWPERMDLWERCGVIWRDLTLGKHREAAAEAFYEANRAEMDRGVVVLDPDLEPIYNLFKQIWTDGLRSFLREKQNDPTDASAQLFLTEKFHRFQIRGSEIVRADGRRVKLAELHKSAFWDPSTGLIDGDFACIVVIGRDRWGYKYVLDAWLAQLKVTEQLAAAWRLGERWGLAVMHFESNGFQALVAETFARQQEERRKDGKFWQLAMVGHTSTENKQGRISALEPDTAAGWLQFAEYLPAEYLAQFAAFPGGDHDDAPDATQRAWELAGGRPITMSDEPLGGRRP